MNYPTSYTSTVSVPLPDDAAIRSVIGDTYDPGTALNVIKMFAGTGDLYPALIGMVNAIFGTKDIDAKHRKMIILRAAKVLDTPYEWQANATMAGNAGLSTPLNAESHAGLPSAILVTNGFDPLRDVGHAYARKLAAAGNDLTYVQNPNLTHGFPQFTRSSAACHQATLELADLIKTKIG